MIINPKILGMMLVIITSILLLIVAAIPSQNTQASTLAGLDIATGNVADLDVAEAENATTTTTTSGASETAASGNMTGARFLSIQNAQSGTLSQINSTTYTLELENVSHKTILFSDRPDRIVTSVSTADFIGNWTVGGTEDSFVIDPPNAVLVLDEEDEERQQDIAIITLFNPTYDSEANILKFNIIPENATSLELPTEFGQSTLVIDETEGHTVTKYPIETD